MLKTRIACAVLSTRDQLIAIVEAILANKLVELDLATTPAGERIVELRGPVVPRAIRLPMTIVKGAGNKWQVRIDALDAGQRRELDALLEHARAARAAGAPERAPARRSDRAVARPEQKPHSVLSADGRRLVRRPAQEMVTRVERRRPVVRAAVQELVENIVDPASRIQEPASEQPASEQPASEQPASEERPRDNLRQQPVPEIVEAPPASVEVPVAEPSHIEAARPLLERLDELTDFEAYAAEIEIVEEALVTLACRADAHSLEDLVRGLKQRAGDAGPRERTRAGLVARALFRLRDPELLAPVAATMLASTEASDSARSVLVLLGAAGAQAMVRARRSRELNDEARASFIAVLRDRGAEAFAAIAAGLEDADREGDDAWAEDLLRALPDSEHEPLACAASRYVAHASPALRRAAIHALGGLGGAQAIPKLRAALGDEEASVRRAACAALRRIKGLDVETAVGLTKIACGDVESALELRVMAAAALAQCADGARVVCIEALRRIVDPPARSLRDLLGRPNGENELVVATACRTLLAIGGDEGRRAVERRSAASGGELKRKLRAMLSSGSSYS